MFKQIKTDELKPGMYVILPYSWLKKIFKTSAFRIISTEQIKNILREGIQELYIDTEKSTFSVSQSSYAQADKPAVAVTSIIMENQQPAVPVLTPSAEEEFLGWLGTFSAADFQEMLNTPVKVPEQKAKVVYRSTMQLVNQLMSSPTTQNISAGKEHIYNLVDFILKEEESTDWLISLTAHDFYTYTHSVNVGFLGIMLAKELFKRSSAHDLHELGAGFFMHDIGKTRVPRSIINSSSKLSAEEIHIMHQHPQYGYKILQEAHQLSEECRCIVLEHHERADGKGYPQGLAGNDISLYGRICALADVYDALTAQRSYKPGYTPFESLKIMKEEMISNFDKELFSKFVLLFK